MVAKTAQVVSLILVGFRRSSAWCWVLGVVVSYSSAVLATRVAKVLLSFLLETFLKLAALCNLALGLLRGNVLALVVVDVPSDFQVEICLSRGRCDTLGSRVRFTGSDGTIWCGLVGLQAARRVCCDAEVASERWSDIRRASLGIDLEMSVSLRCDVSLDSHTW